MKHTMASCLHRVLLRIALLITTVGVAFASFAHEAMDPLQVLPTLLDASPWGAVWQPLLIITGICGIGTLAVARCTPWLRAERMLIAQTVGLLAAVTTYSYDLCSDIGVSWLPTLNGCHCWLTGAAALLATILSLTLLFIVGLFTARLILHGAAHAAPYLRRLLQRLFIARERAAKLPSFMPACTKLITFRGPPHSIRLAA
jgi:hypothetical protein